MPAGRLTARRALRPASISGDRNVEDEDQKRRQKRFKVTGTGKVLAAQSGKRHGMIKRTPKQVRQKRGTDTLSAPDAKIVKQHYLPYSR